MLFYMKSVYVSTPQHGSPINKKLLWRVQMLHGAVFSKRAPWPPEAEKNKL
jgi:hypothetical protein